MKRLHLVHRLVAPLPLLAALACGGDDLVFPTEGTDEAPSSSSPARLAIYGGDDQVGTPGLPLSRPVVVRLVDQAGDGIGRQPVTWLVSAGGGSVTPQTPTTDDQGFAAANWTLGSQGGNSLEAVVIGVGTVTFTATLDSSGSDGGGDDGSGDDGSGDDGSGGGGTGGGGTGGGGTGGGGTGGGGAGTVPSAGASTISVDPASIQAGSGLSTIRVTVRDAAGVPVPGAIVTLTATGSGNILTQPTAPTGPDGVAIGTLRSSVAGTKDVVATVNGTVPIAQTAQVFVAVAPASRLEIVAGNNQSTRTGEQVPVSPAVRVTNALGQPVAGFGVTFVVTAGGGTVTGASQTTNADGIARVGSWTLGSGEQNTLEARAGSLSGSPVVFQATATSPPPPPPPPPAAEPDHFVFRVQPHDVETNEWFTVEVAIVDANGNVVPLDGTQIYLGLFRAGADTPNNAELAGDRFVDTQNGIAVFNLYVKDEGTFRFMARSDYLPKELGPYGPELFSNTFQVR